MLRSASLLDGSGGVIDFVYKNKWHKILVRVTNLQVLRKHVMFSVVTAEFLMGNGNRSVDAIVYVGRVVWPFLYFALK